MADLDVATLERQLQRTVEGEIRFDDGTRGLYATDASNYRQVPIGVVIPKSIDDVVATHAACHEHDAPIVARGAGTSLSGETVNVAVVIDFSKYLHEILDIDVHRKLARVQPGVLHDQLTDRTREHKLVFAPDPSTHEYCTIGGNIGNNSCGVHSVQAQFLGEGARTSDNVHEMEVLTHDGCRMHVGPTDDEELAGIIAAGGRRGEIYAALRDLRDRYAPLIRERFPDIPRRVSGYNLDELLPEKGFNVARALVGTEGTCATVLEATVKLVYDPPARTLIVVGYENIFRAGEHIPKILTHEPLGCEGMDDELIKSQRIMGMHADALELLPEGRGWLLVELGGEDRGESDDKARALIEDLEKDDDPPVDARLLDDPEKEARLWEVREAGLAATAFPPGDERDHWPGWEDSAVPPDVVGPYLRDLRRLYDKYDLSGALYGHLGQGCIHSRISFDLRTAEGVKRYRSFVEEAADLCVSYGGSLSGEHGDGQARAELLPRMYGEELVEAFREFKRIWDPTWKMNPGKVVDPRPLDEDLKLHPAKYSPPDVATHFSYPDDGGNFAHTTIRCVGVGKCRRVEGGTMCPSYMVTREEKHTTRGRARMLFEMLQGNPVGDGWRDNDVKDSLDLCLACKGCKGDCPVNVDMATYKAEFVSRYYKGRLRPRPAYAMGLIYWWARLAARVPNIVNLVTHMPILSTLVMKAGGLAPQRDAPAFATETFRHWFERRPSNDSAHEEVVLWPDTFNNFLHPEVAKCAVEVLEALGFRVVLPDRSLCCGRPLYDYGMLDVAKRLLHETIEQLRPHLVAGTPIVGLEPSCVAVFRDELPNLLPHNEDAKRLAGQFHTFGEFAANQVDGKGWALERKAIVHPHCHHDAVMGLDPDRRVLSGLGVDFEMSDAGCCGLAGSFGFEAGEKYDVSIAAGERKLAPLVRDAPHDSLIIADGFSCKTQIETLTDRRALHLAQVMHMAITAGPGGPQGTPEVGYSDRDGSTRPTRFETALIAGAGLAGIAAALTRRR